MLQAGTASFDITPTRMVQLQGHSCPDVAVGVLAPIEGQALVLYDGQRTIALISLDVVAVTGQITGRIRQGIERETSISGDHVLVAASHTHCAPATKPDMGIDIDESWLQGVEDKAVRAVGEAYQQMIEATLRVGQASACFNINRRPVKGGHLNFTVNYGGICDRRVRVLFVDRPDGTPIATAFHYACHTSSKGGSDLLVSPDYPGFARGVIERERGGVAMFLPGCFGNVRTQVTPRGGFESASEAQLQQLGEEMGRAVLLADKRSAPIDDTRVDAEVWPIQYAFGALPDDDTLKEWREYSTQPHAIDLRPLVDSIAAMKRDGVSPDPLESELQRIDLGELTLIAIGGEAPMEFGYAIEKMFTENECWAMGYSNDMVGYLCTELHKLEGGYEPTAYPYFHHPAPFAEEEQTILDTVERHLTPRAASHAAAGG